VSLPAADDLFRKTEGEGRDDKHVRAVPDPVPSESDAAAGKQRRPSGRVRHDEKMTVYVTAEELIDLEDARLTLRREHGLAVDRGRLVREAVALVLADLEENGLDSSIVRRLVDR
jgi:hypothetical protein